MKILIIEDEHSLNRSMVDYLTAQQYLVETAQDYKSALEKIESYEYDCIVLDLDRNYSLDFSHTDKILSVASVTIMSRGHRSHKTNYLV